MRRNVKPSATALLAQDRRRREDEAPRLRDQIPSVAKLNLTIEEGPLATGLHPLRYTRPIVVAHAPALFLLPCGDPRCVDGGYDLTRAVLSGLASHAPRFSGECACEGSVGSSACGRKLRFLADADYASELAAV